MEKIRKANVPLIVVAREEFGKFEGVITFSKKIPYGEVIKAISAHLKSDVNFDRDVVCTDGACTELPPEYVLIGKYAVKKTLLDKIKRELDEIKPEKLTDVKPVLEKHNLGYWVLEAVGYKVVWNGLSEDDAVILPADNEKR
jgi:hypothetical protein